MATGVHEIPADTRDISSLVLDGDGRMQIHPAAFWVDKTAAERSLFGHRYGVYSFPTVELVDYLRDLIGGRSAIEIGAGNGVLAEALDITATDSYQQNQPKYKAIYEGSGMATVPYGENVIEMNASRAVRAFKPQVVIGCWVTHKYDRQRHWAGGNEVGVDEMDVISHCEQYVMIGNEQTHAEKAIWARRHSIVYPSFVYSRAHNGTREFIAVWDGLAGVPRPAPAARRTGKSRRR